MKERLTGAIILVALMVLLVPELLTGPVRSAPRAAPDASSGEGAPMRSYTINLADDGRARGVDRMSDGAAAGSAGPPSPGPLESAPRVEAAQRATAAVDVAPAVSVAEDAGSASAAAASPAPPHGARPVARVPPASPGAGSAAGWAVQLGSFAQRANAERLASEVRAQGFKVSISQESSGRRLYRVRVGPAHDRAAASALASQLQASGHHGALVPK